MRIAFWLLLLINLLLFIWMQGYIGPQDASREPERLARQITPEKLHILSEATPVKAAAEKPASACKRIVGLSADEAKSLSDAVHVRGGWETQTLPQPASPLYWVAIADLPNSTLAEKKKAELRQFGVTESEIVPGTSPGSFAVSLGLFREAQRAQAFLQALLDKGVRSARVISRETPADKFAVELRAPTDQLAATLPGLSAALPGAVTQDCPP
ncbi:hypothetical protein MASR1M60_28450 [Rhodocyclaceae bacterium]